MTCLRSVVLARKQRRHVIFHRAKPVNETESVFLKEHYVKDYAFSEEG